MSVIQTIHQVVQVSKHRLSGIGSISDFKLSYFHRSVILNTSLCVQCGLNFKVMDMLPAAGTVSSYT